MGTEVIELAIRSARAGVSEQEFIAAKDAAVRALVSIPGIGPEREFAPFTTMPAQARRVFVGTTRYASQGRVRRAMFSPGFMLKLLPFMRRMDPLAGIFIKPRDAGFAYEHFAMRGNVVEIALLRPRGGAERSFEEGRTTFLGRLDQQPGVVRSYVFDVTGGFKNTDVLVHFTVYESREAFDGLARKLREEEWVSRFLAMFEPALISFCEVIK